MKTEWFSDADQGELDRAHDECNASLERLSADFKLACQRAARARDRIEARVFDRVASRLGVPVAAVQPVRDSVGIPLGVTFQDAAQPVSPG